MEIIIIAGPNGAGKTSFTNQYLLVPGELRPYVNADDIAQELARPGISRQALDVLAAREMLQRMGALVAQRASFMFETTLASLTYAQKVRQWREVGYRIGLIYLRLPSVDASIERVNKRVASGGHGIPEDVIRARFAKSLQYLDQLYKPVVDQWYVWDSVEGGFRLAQSWDDR
jgi:predicted ABC-type ATPase